ncbi:LysE family translocator [Streptomyces sp. XM83C]|uniref:LysE family translocator n=1 Tax=Streptomyces thermocoprophilus TaxID=78356 RepID=A0ABV5VAI9_9ACTN|nr:LysE family translocator [Streptomyces sp. XM83C]MCK1821501.1 LysE family translocator [Streptomyces sp. XM83C]
MSLAFLLTTLAVVVTPGTGVVHTLAAGLAHGRRAGVVAALAGTVGTVPHALASVTGLAALLHASPTAFQILKYAGVACLLYMAWATLRDKSAITVDGTGGGPGPVGRVIVRGVLANLLNPKLSVFFLAFLPQFVDPADPHALPRMLALSGVFMALTFVVFAAYGVLAAAVRGQVLSRPRVMTWLRRVFAGSFVGLGVKLAGS